METSWQATLLGRGPGERGGALGSAGAQVEARTAMLHTHRCLQVVAARPSSIGQTGWPDTGKAGKFHEILKAGLKLHCNYTVITLHL